MNRLTIFFLFLSLSSFAQIKEQIADKYFNKQEYANCVEMYDELAASFLKGKKKGNIESIRKAAVSHYHLFQMTEACDYFSKYKEKNQGKLNEQDRELYIKALRFNQNYDDAKKMIAESRTAYPENKLFKTLDENQSKFAEFFADSSFYKIKTLNINSGKGDFGATYYGNSIIYASKANNTGFVNSPYGWDNAYYINLKKAELGTDSVPQQPQLLRGSFLSRAHDGPVSFTPDGLEQAITKNIIEKVAGESRVHLAIYFSKFINGEWSELVPFQYNDKQFDFGHAVYADNGNTLYFVSNKPGGFGMADIYVSHRENNGWSNPVNLGAKINTSSNELFPFVADNTLYFASEGHFGMGGLDLFQCKLTDNEPPKNLGYPVNTSHDDFNLILNASGKAGYISSNREDNIDRLYAISINPVNIMLKGNVYALYKEKEILKEEWVYIIDLATNQKDSVKTDENGNYTLPLKQNAEYAIYVPKEDFKMQDTVRIQTKDIKKSTTLEKDLALIPTTIITHFFVTDAKTGEPIPNAEVVITDADNKPVATLKSDENGLITQKLPRNQEYHINSQKVSYIDKELPISTISNEKELSMVIPLTKIVKGDKFTLENIFYDLGKATLREESKVSLDKLAEFIIENKVKVKLSSHTDARGSSASNQKLSQARAQSCVDYLINKGVPKHLIIAKGYGETQLVNKCKDGVTCSEEEHQANRRTEAKVLEVVN